jgi:hypothetical protein
MSLDRPSGLDPGAAAFVAGARKEAGCRIKSGMTSGKCPTLIDSWPNYQLPACLIRSSITSPVETEIDIVAIIHQRRRFP